MKAIIITLVAVLVAVLVLVIGVSFASQSQDVYEVAPTIEYANILDEKEGGQLYYFYQPTCSHCIDLKPTIEEFYGKLEDTDELNFSTVDMSLSENAQGWYDWNTHYEEYGEETAATARRKRIEREDRERNKTGDSKDGEGRKGEHGN